MDASELKNEDRVNALFVGGSGCGKKAAACTFPHPIKYLDLDARVRGLLGSDWVERKGIDFKYYPPIKQAGQKMIYQELNDDFEQMMIQAGVMKFPYKTIVLASATGLFSALLKDAVLLTHQLGNEKGQEGGKKGQYIGALAIADPGDYHFVYTAIRNVLSFLRSIPGVNIIVMGHTVPRYAKPIKADGTVDAYADNVVVGSKLSVTDKAAAEIPTSFDNVWEFSKTFDGSKEKFYVQFRSDMARTSYPLLPNGMVDITRKNFYEYLQSKLGTQISAGAEVNTNTKAL